MKHCIPCLKISRVPVILMVLLMLPGTVFGAGLTPGSYSGPIKTPGGDLTIVFNIETADGGATYIATCDSPDQGAFGIPVESVSLDGNDVTIMIPAVMGKYTGTLDDSGTKITGQWHQSGRSMDCTVALGDKPAGPKRPQNPEPPFPYDTEDVTFSNAEGGAILAGTLTIPRGDGPFPGVVLVHGSGPNDRDETVFGHKPFLVLADHLTRQGIAVLRYDKRGIGKSTGDIETATSADFAADAAAALAFLATHDTVAGDKTGLIGHSEGGIIVPHIAAAQPDTVAFIGLLAAPGVPGKELITRQLETILKLSGADEDTLKNALDQQKTMFDIVLNEPDPDKATAKLDAEMEKRHAALTEEEKQMPGMSLEAMKLSAQQVNSPWFRYFLTKDPRVDLVKVTCPVLALWGGKDCQVVPEQNRPEIEKALQAAGNTKVTFKTFPGVNHLFQTAETGLPGEYAQIEETVSPEVLNFISGWILGLYKTP